MNDASVRTFRLPRIRTDKIGNHLARSTLIRLFESLRVGSITLHEGSESFSFGDPEHAGQPHGEINIHDASVYRHLLLGGSIGAGESFMQGHWSSANLTEVIQVFTANMHLLQAMDAKQSLLKRAGLAVAHLLNRNTLNGSRRNISAHYDLGNDFF